PGTTKYFSDEERSRRKRHQVAESYSQHDPFDLSKIHFNLEALREELGFDDFDDLDEAQFRALSAEDRLQIFDRNIASIESERCGLNGTCVDAMSANTKETRLGAGPMDVAVHPQFPSKSAGRYVAQLSYIDFSPTTGLEAFLNGIRCNACFAQAHGREELAAALWSWFFRLLAKHQPELERDTFWGWDQIRELLPSFPSEIQPAVRSILQAESVASQGSTVLHPSSLEIIQSLHGRFMGIWDGMPEPLASQLKGRNSRIERWCRGFKALTDYLAWLHASTREIQENPQVLVDWALSQDGNALN
ncbi:unnamed protein product, partial [Clonostachys chloroleuca]